MRTKKSIIATIIISVIIILIIFYFPFTKKKYYITGELEVEYQVRGVFSTTLHGTFKHYEPNGLLTQKDSYYKGELDGITELYYRNNGKLKAKIEYRKGKLMNIIEYYDNKGNRFDYGKLKDGNGYIKLFSDEYGKYVLEGPVVNGLRDGLWKSYYLDPDCPLLVDTVFYIKGTDQNGLKEPFTFW